MADRYTADQIAERLDRLLEVEFTFIDTTGPAEGLAAMTRPEQEFILNLVARVASTNVEIGHRVARHAARALDAMDERTVEAWALHATDTYDRAGLRPALQAVEEIERFELLDRVRHSGALLEDTAGMLLPFLRGLSGRPLRLEEADVAYTDSETVFLPATLAELPTSRDNLLLYKACAAYLWAQTRFGTFRVPLTESLSRQPDPDRVLALFASAERLRLDACLQRELPGLYRQLRELAELAGDPAVPAVWLSAMEELQRPEATAHHSLALAEAQPGRLSPLDCCYQGELRPRAVAACMAERIDREKTLFKLALRDLRDELREVSPPGEAPPGQFDVRPPAEARGDSLEVELFLDDKPVAPPENVRRLSQSILLDFGNIPPEYLVPAGAGDYDPRAQTGPERDPWQGTYHEEGAFFYNEWDHGRQHYRKNWCVVREVEVPPEADGFRERTLQKYAGLVRHLRKSFEAMRDEDRTLTRQPDGDDVDLDALVEALADARNGTELSERVYTRLHRSERDIAVVFMVDMSGSTKGWINDAERESLVLLAEALETLGDRFAIYGFSGMTRKRCEIFPVKALDEPYGPAVQARISGIRPKDYTRMGFAIRHLTQLLAETDARTRILITLSDGKPDDYSDYRGEYGIEDTRRALIEARRAGIHPYCITIDQEGQEYLPHMYGPAAYTVVDDVRRLPYRVADIYRRLTT